MTTNLQIAPADFTPLYWEDVTDLAWTPIGWAPVTMETMQRAILAAPDAPVPVFIRPGLMPVRSRYEVWTEVCVPVGTDADEALYALAIDWWDLEVEVPEVPPVRDLQSGW